MRPLFPALGLAAGLSLLVAFRPAPTPTSAPASATMEAEAYTIDGGHSTVMFAVKHLGVSYTYGRFNQIEGEFHVDEQNAENSHVRIVLKAESVDTGSEGRDKHLRSGDFFNAGEFPEIVFTSQGVAHEEGVIVVEGELELLGKKKPLRVELEHVGRGDRGQRFGFRTGYHGGFKLERSEFGMDFMAGETGIGDEVEVTISIEGVRK